MKLKATLNWCKKGFFIKNLGKNKSYIKRREKTSSQQTPPYLFAEPSPIKSLHLPPCHIKTTKTKT